MLDVSEDMRRLRSAQTPTSPAARCNERRRVPTELRVRPPLAPQSRGPLADRAAATMVRHVGTKWDKVTATKEANDASGRSSGIEHRAGPVPYHGRRSRHFVSESARLSLR